MRAEWRWPGGTLLDQAGRVRGSHRFSLPCRALEAHVVEVWRQRYDDGVRADPRPWRIAPDLRPHLLVHACAASGTAGVRVVGARSGHLDRPAGGRRWSAGVSLRPGTLPALTGLPASDFRDRSVDAGEVWGSAGKRLSERIRGAGDPGEVVELLQVFLAERSVRARTVSDWRVRAFLDLASAGKAAPRVGEIARALGISTRSMREVWSREVGLSPREALSIGRLRGALRRAVLDPGPSWSRIAPASGYAGQAHLIRDAHRYLGETPGAFLARRRPVAGGAGS